ncbi:MAG: hypothetical protein HZB54_08465 [Deltaproteobacteria bacterium]|nr:hypothetical protein [Deltaproteobacteria bacterium]
MVLKAKSRYILSDTIKAAKAEDFCMMPADIGISYVNTADPMKGGKGHTIRVCMKQWIPVIDQRE